MKANKDDQRRQTVVNEMVYMIFAGWMAGQSLHYLSKLDGEGAEVGDDCCTQQDVAGDVEVVITEDTRVLSPPVLLASQTADQLLGAVELLRAQRDVVLEHLLLPRHRLELVAESLQLVRHLHPR